MAFHESRLLDCVAFGWTGGPSWLTEVVSARSGFESRNGAWAQARHAYEIGLTARPLSEFESIKAAFMVCGGRRDGFRWRDASDYQCSNTEGDPQPIDSNGDPVGTAGLGYGVPTYQAAKTYTFAGVSHARHIRKPSGTFVLRRNGGTVTAGVGAGNYAVSTTTGMITFVADQSRVISSHTVGADHVFTLASAFSPNLAVGGRIYVTGVTGTAADVLNNLSHEVTVVSAAVITVATSTTGLTASGGTAYYYPQPTDTLDCACDFDVPVRFDTDEFRPTIINRQGAEGELLIELPSIPLVEIRV
jgi:uncharacterized protein (TIGR02217 family)